MNAPAELRCHDCGSPQLDFANAYPRFRRVTSDCKPWPAGGQFALCRACGLVQTITDDRWQAEADEIYRAYTIYHQSGGIEQPVFNAETGAGRSRSDAVVEALLRYQPPAARGRLLDIGCGNGAFLRACSRALPGWSLCGSEVSDKYKAIVEQIPGVERMYGGPWEEIPGTFDLISMIHVLEHIPGPTAFLNRLAAKLNPGGLLLLEVPDCAQNPFTLLIADHSTHFSPAMLGSVAAKAGFEVLCATAAWVPKEATVVARLAGLRTPPAPTPPDESRTVFQGCQVLERIVAQVEQLASEGPFGIFGTSIAATWLDSQTGGQAGFFVDEDANRVGKRHLGRPILAVSEVPEGSVLYLALAPALATRVAQRLSQTHPRLLLRTP